MKKADFDKIKKPERNKSNTRSASRTKKDYFEGSDGKKIPKHCRSFLATGVCEWEKKPENKGKTCCIPHYTQPKYDAKYKSLNPSS